jgi:hypothetical protein
MITQVIYCAVSATPYYATQEFLEFIDEYVSHSDGKLKQHQVVAFDAVAYFNPTTSHIEFCVSGIVEMITTE